MKAVELLREYANIDFGCYMGTHQEECLEAIAELEAIIKSKTKEIERLKRELCYEKISIRSIKDL